MTTRKLTSSVLVQFLAVAACGSLPSSVARAQSPEVPVKVSLCEMYADIHDKHDKSYGNRVVRFQAEFTVTAHGAFYSDESCPNTIFMFDSVARMSGSIGHLGELLDWVYSTRFDLPLVRPACVCVARVKIENEAPKLNIVDVEEIWIPRNPIRPGSQ
jgi:hypothetical protein